MKKRFDGESGKRLLLEVLLVQRLVEHDSTVAAQLLEAGTVVEFATGQTMIRQDSTDNDVYFILSGEVSVLVNARRVAGRSPGDSVGEMALIDGSAPRSATVVASKPVCTLKVSEESFRSVADRHPHVWRAIARVVSERLRQRTQFHRPPNDKPILFVGSSVEGLPVAKHIQLGMKHIAAVVQLWNNGVFGPSGIAIDSLMDQAEKCDFALFVFGPDDKVASRSQEYFAPRDNVVFELGLFMGRLDRDRCFLVREHSSELKIPTDLLGVTPLTYVLASGGDLALSVATVCTELEVAICRLGVK